MGLGLRQTRRNKEAICGEENLRRALEREKTVSALGEKEPSGGGGGGE